MILDGILGTVIGVLYDFVTFVNLTPFHFVTDVTPIGLREGKVQF